MSENNVDTNNEVTSETSAIWRNHVPAPNTPDGFTLRTTFPANPDGVEVMLEKWEQVRKNHHIRTQVMI